MQHIKRAIGLVIIIGLAGIVAFVVYEAENRDVLRSTKHSITEQAIFRLVLDVKRIAATNGLPSSDEELMRILPGALPVDGWGQAVHYHRFNSNRFTVSAMSPWPEVLVFSYDSTNAAAHFSKYLF